MKSAILISGYLRSFEHNLENIKEKIINKLGVVDIYVHITKNESTEDRYLNKNIKELENKIKEVLNPIVVLHEPNIFFSKNLKINTIYNQWVKYYKLNILRKINEKISGKYDLVIKYRPDIQLLSDINFNEFLNTNDLIIPIDSKIDKNKLSNINDGFVSDILAFGSPDIMDEYFNIFNNLENLIDEYGTTPETILFEYIKDKIQYKEVDIDYYVILSNCNVFAICGDSGSGKTTLGNLLKKYFSSSLLLECDRYHKWERNDNNWLKMTHLNPDANFLTKMNQDIFDLKIGKSVYSVDYDHTSGKFTQKQKIENPENLIVCGLHSLYNDEDNLYNIKIFMDTDEKLKTKWKIKRDVEIRGYEVEKVLNQIEKRRDDYSKYIEPQKKNSDVIINFYEGDNNQTCLKIKLNKNINCDGLIEVFKDKNVSILYEQNHIVFNIIEYKNYDLLNTLNFRTFDLYDYVIYFLLNINK